MIWLVIPKGLDVLGLGARQQSCRLDLVGNLLRKTGHDPANKTADKEQLGTSTAMAWEFLADSSGLLECQHYHPHLHTLPLTTQLMCTSSTFAWVCKPLGTHQVLV